MQLPMVNPSGSFYEPNEGTVKYLNETPWIAAFSGGKDSTSLATWLEWLRRTEQISVMEPRLVMSDTTVEYPFLADIAKELIKCLRDSGWICNVVKPRRKDKLYNYIFGRGMTPVNRNFKKMRWCTAVTKVSPMETFRRSVGKGYSFLTGMRFGESKMRDGKLNANAGIASCSSGGECGTYIAEKKDRPTFPPIVNWTSCHVVDWLSGGVAKEVRRVIPDFLPLMAKLAEVYEMEKVKTDDSFFGEEKIRNLRFGCIGCPAIPQDKVVIRKIALDSQFANLRPLGRLYYIWDELRKPYNRLIRISDKTGEDELGPIKMEVRKKWFAEVLEIQERSGLTIVDEKDIAYIYKCWANKVYPRGWENME